MGWGVFLFLCYTFTISGFIKELNLCISITCFTFILKVTVRHCYDFFLFIPIIIHLILFLFIRLIYLACLVQYFPNVVLSSLHASLSFSFLFYIFK
uniref:Uncharacterized protein n=1 Tax=Psorophora albipes TaxID=869069 RepID=T1E2R3_9DIPT